MTDITQELVDSLQAERERMNTLVAKLEAQLAAMTQRAEAAEAELRESERDLSDMAANSNRLHTIAEQMRQRAVAAEADTRVLRTLVSMASVQHAIRAEDEDGDDRGPRVIMASYVAALFDAAAKNGAFANDHCDPAAVARLAESMGTKLDDAQEAQP